MVPACVSAGIPIYTSPVLVKFIHMLCHITCPKYTYLSSLNIHLQCLLVGIFATMLFNNNYIYEDLTQVGCLAHIQDNAT